MNNPNIKNSDLLDLHNLTVKEAVAALKQIMFEKKQRKHCLIKLLLEKVR